MTQIDDLRVGGWYAIKSERELDEQTSFADFPFAIRKRRRSAVTGEPLRILAISLPFIVVTNGHDRFPLDVRQYEFIRLDRRYVDAITTSRGPELIGNVFLDEEKRIASDIKRGKKQKPDPRLCPHCCEGRLHQLHRSGEWLFVCPVCGYEGRPPTSQAKR